MYPTEIANAIATMRFPNTHHPFQTAKTAHLSGGVHGRHTVFGPDVKRASGFEHEELEHFQVSLLRRQINGRDVIVHLSVSAAKKKNHEHRKLDICMDVCQYDNYLGQGFPNVSPSSFRTPPTHRNRVNSNIIISYIVKFVHDITWIIPNRK